MAERMRAGWTWGWQFDGACRAMIRPVLRARLFEKREEEGRARGKAKAICTECSVRDPCLELQPRIRESHGIWGGLNEYERRQRLRQQALQAG